MQDPDHIYENGSFRDPSGFIFYRDGAVYRQINTSYKDPYGHLMRSGLYNDLVGAGLLVRHEEVDIAAPVPEKAHKVIRPEKIDFISYPYEWSFSQLKAAALALLEIQKRAIGLGMVLKDASAYNMQFRHGRPVLMDTISFDVYRDASPWVAYGQFCRHFLAPLAIMSYTDVRLNQLSRVYIDGIPLDLASALLPFRTRLNIGMLFHIHLHAACQERFADKTIEVKSLRFSREAHVKLIEGLTRATGHLQWKPEKGAWAGYYSDTSYGEAGLEGKKKIVASFLDRIRPRTLWDVGANTGLFSREAARKGIETVSIDMDPACVELNYLRCVKDGLTNILPLLIDLTSPSPAIGWENRERMSFMERGPADAVLALALIHHLAISNNLPLGMIADFFMRICDRLIIEFVPKTDPQVKRLLASREDIFPDYTREDFERVFAGPFNILESVKVEKTDRIIYLMEKRPGTHV